MMRVVLSIGVLMLVCIASVADARRHRAAVVPICNNLDIVNPCPGYMVPGVFKMFGAPPKAEIHIRIPRARAHSRQRPIAKSAPSVNLNVDKMDGGHLGIIEPLAAKVSEILGACGSKVISGLRHTFIAGTRRMSLHASGKAVDMAGNPGCIYAHLTGWQGGYSTDYQRVRHVHLSYDPDGHREWGIRFVHRGHARRGRHRRTRR